MDKNKMSLEDAKKLIDGDPRDLIKKANEYGIDFSGLDKNIAREMVRTQLSLPESHFDAADFVFWMSYYVEKEAESLIIDPEVMVGGRKIAMESVVSKLHFGEKIKVIEELHASKNDSFIKIMRVIQDLRNHVAHGRFDKLEYEGFHLSDNRGKLILIADLRDRLLKK